MSVLSEINRIKNAVTDIGNAIKAKGVTVPTTAKIGDLAQLVSSIITPSGTKEITSAGTHDVAQYASATVAEGSATTPATTITAKPSLATTYTSGSGYKMTVSKTQSVTPSVSAGYVSSGTAGTITVSGSDYVPQSSTGSATTSTTDTATRNIGYGQQTTIGAGYYPNDRIVRNSVSAGKAQTPSTTITATNTITIDDNGLITATASGSKSITPTVTSGYVSSGTAGTVSVSGTGTKQLTKRTSSSLTASGLTVTAPAGYYHSDATKTVTDSNLVASNIKKNVTIFGVTGDYEPPSLETCNVTITFGDSVGYVRVVATTFANGAFGVFNQNKSSGTFTLENVVCNSVISLGGYNNFDVSKSYSGTKSYFSDSAYWMVAPSTAGNYTAQIIAYED